MSTELTLLVWSAVLVGVYVLVQSSFYRIDYGTQHGASARDNERTSNVMTQRSDKALRNLLESYGVFVALAVATELSGRSDSLTRWGVHLWFWARWAYLPAYLSAIPFLRSAIWLVSIIGLGLMFLGVAF